MTELREITREDLPLINRWRHDRGVVDRLGGPFRFITEEVDGQWFDHYLSRRSTEVRCAICVAGTREAVGVVNLTQIDAVHRNAELGIIVGAPEAQNRGVGTAATLLMLKHAFGDLNLHRVYLYVLEDNERAIRLYEKAGFKREGLCREAAYKNGRYHNLLLMSILRSEFDA